MTNDPGSEIRDRFRASALPPAPVRLRERLADVASSPTAVKKTSTFERVRPLIALAAVLALASIGLLVSGGTDQPSPSPEAADWGPLAVADLDGSMQARTEGTLVLTDACAFIEYSDGERALLVWPADRSRWDPATGAVSVEDERTSAMVAFSNGQPIALGGGGSSVAEGGLSGEEWAAGFDWVAPPAPECLTASRWIVGAATQPMAWDTAAPPAYRFICEEAEPPALTCVEILDTTLVALDGARNVEDAVEIDVSRACDAPCPPEPRSVHVLVTFDALVGDFLVVAILPTDGGIAWSVMPPAERALEYDVVFGAEPPVGSGVPIIRAGLDDPQSLAVKVLDDFGCPTTYEPWVGPNSEVLTVKVMSVPDPESTLCPGSGAIGIFTLTLVLPEPISGSTVHDLSSGQAFELP